MLSINLEKYRLRYKKIYSTVALILAILAVVSGCWLSSLGYQPEVSGWTLNVFGCAILYNENNMAPGFFLFLAGLLLIIVTQYRVRIDRESKREKDIDEQTLRHKFTYSMTGLISGFFSIVFGIVLAENGGNLCPTGWAAAITNYQNLFFAGVIFFLAGIITVIATRYRFRVDNGIGEVNGQEVNN